MRLEKTALPDSPVKQSPYLNAFSMLPTAKRSSSSTSLKSSRSAPSTPQHRRRAQTPSGTRESSVAFTLEFNGGLRGASYRLAIKQQPAGGHNPVTVFSGVVSNGDTLTFFSRRSTGQNFNATIYIDALRYHQLSGCCENRYKEGSSFGNRLTIRKIDNVKPCYKCQFEKELKKQR
ncbi:uncharacterized protein LOC114828556 [Galendromus occidentalis]|uniref:Uncharacterized protein LOC114828556 n=1 Tax=Galendromus occidentalis TaxID=34638 RepID=A0AAJ7WK64_9ACAR|nr:uncharacterized protein LOC114828556 [Galendromus occidentalis]